jgi:hypothetical protein
VLFAFAFAAPLSRKMPSIYFPLAFASGYCPPAGGQWFTWVSQPKNLCPGYCPVQLLLKEELVDSLAHQIIKIWGF